jgi:hypothetical protein
VSTSNPTSRAKDEGLHGRVNIFSLLIIYSSTALMIAAVYFVVNLVVINPHSVTSSVISNEIPKLQIGKEITQTSKQKTVTNNALSTVLVNSPKADGATQFSIPTSRRNYVG